MMIKLPDIELPDKNIDTSEFIDYTIHKGYKMETSEDPYSLEMILVGKNVTETYLYNPVTKTLSKVKIEGEGKQEVRWSSLLYFTDAPILVLSQSLSIFLLSISIFFTSFLSGVILLAALVSVIALADYGWKNHKMSKVTKTLWKYKKMVIGVSLTTMWTLTLLKIITLLVK